MLSEQFPGERSVIMSIDLLRELASYPGLMWKIAKVKRTISPMRVSYGVDPAQYFLHFAPPGAASDKVILYLHGGGWNSGSPSTFAMIGQRFALAGYHCILIGYRKAPAHRYPAQIEDVCAGYRTALSYLEMMGVGAEQIVVMGSSAGAHLGALLCYDSQLQKRFSIDPGHLRGFAGLGGPYCFHCQPTFVLNKLLDGLFPPQYNRTLGEPWHKLNRGQRVPMLVIHSRRDGVVDYANAEEFYHRARCLDIPAEFYCVPLQGDSHSLYTGGIFLEDSNPTLDALFGWLKRI